MFTLVAKGLALLLTGIFALVALAALLLMIAII